MAVINMRFRGCFKGAGVTDSEAERIVSMADGYDTGDVKQDYSAAVTDLLAYLRESRDVVKQALDEKEGKASPKAEAAKAAEVAPADQIPTDPEGLWDMLVDDGTPNFIAFDRLPTEYQEAWTNAVARGVHSAQLGDDLIADAREDLGLNIKQTSAREEFEDTLRQIEESNNIKDFIYLIDEVIQHAYLDNDQNNVRNGIIARAQEFLANRSKFSAAQDAEIKKRFAALVVEQEKIESHYTRGSMKGKPKPWYAYATENGVLPQITQKRPQLIFTGIPMDEAKARLADKSIGMGNLPNTTAEVIAKEAKPAPSSTGSSASARETTSSPEAEIATRIDQLYSEGEYVLFSNDKAKAELKTFLTEMYAKVSPENRGHLVRGKPLRDYFREDGTPKLRRGMIDKFVIDTVEKSEAQIEADTDAAKAAIAAGEAAQKAKERATLKELRGAPEVKKESDSMFRVFDATDGKFARDDGTLIPNPMSVGQVKMLVNSILSKLRIKPRVVIVKSLADLKASFPDVYARAKAAYSGDFDAITGMGYSFGRGKDATVIMFADSLRTEQQVRFVMAHETLGHFGFRGVFSEEQLNAKLDEAYNSDRRVRAAVDSMVETMGMDKHEAIEEYLADYAAEVDVSTMARFWNWVKSQLNKLGFKFEDDIARMMVNQARKYVRDGKTSHVVSGESLAASFEQSTGRFSRNSTFSHADAVSASHAAAASSQAYSPTEQGGLFSFTDVWGMLSRWATGKRMDIPRAVGRILESVQTLDNKARRSFGLSQIYRMLEQQQNFSRVLLSKYQRMTEKSRKPNLSKDDEYKIGWLLSHAALLRGSAAGDDLIRSQKDLMVRAADGSLQIDENVLREIKAAGLVTAAEFRKGFTVKYDDGKGGTSEYKVPPTQIDENSDVWKAYLEQREVVAEAAIDMMLSNFQAARDETARAIDDLNIGRSGVRAFTADDTRIIRELARMYINTRYEGSTVSNASTELRRDKEKEADELVTAFGRALFNDDVYKVWMRSPDAKPEIVRDLGKFQDAKYDDLRNQLDSIKEKIASEKESFKVQDTVRNLFMLDLQAQNAEYYAKRTILGSYVPFTRRGSEQVRLVARDKNGRAVTLHESSRNILPYFQFETFSEANAEREALNEVFGGDKTWNLMIDDGTGAAVEAEVKLTAEVSSTRKSPDLVESVNFNEFVYMLNRMNINIKPKERERIVTALTETNARARKNLMRSGTPGWDKEVLRSVAEYLEATAHVAAKKRFRHRLDDVFLNNNNWLGDDAKLASLKAAVGAANTDAEREEAQRMYAQYAYQYIYMKPAGAPDVEIAGKKYKTMGRGEDYREDAKKIIRWYGENANIANSTEDFLSGGVASELKMWTVVAQLGGSVATAVINLTSLGTHTIPYLSTYNAATGFGGGYGAAKSGTAVYRALADVKNFKLSDDAFLVEMVRNGDWKKFGLSEAEAKFMLQATEEGILQAAQFNALLGTARGKGARSNRTQDIIQKYMSMFSYTEQLNRRATALAAFRLEYDRAIAQGKSETVAVDDATEAARHAVNYSQGEYAMFNRPEMARGNFMQYLFIYKQFTIITVQLIKAMPRSGQLSTLALLMLASGMKGLPFAEDLMDIIDTICQMLGIPVASVEKEMMELVSAVAPGATPTIMKGALDQFFGTTISSRMGMGDLVPLTGVLRAGASPWEEFKNLAGPVYGGMAGAAVTAGNIAAYTAETIGVKDDTTSVADIMRNSPVAAMRSVADGTVYLVDGRITNKQGDVVTDDVSSGVALARMMGFYPLEATVQNDAIRLSKYVADYAKEVKANYAQAYKKAYLNNDQETMQRISKYVRDWNADAKGSGLEIADFEKSVRRSSKEASQPLVERYLKSAPKNVKPETIEMLEAMGYDTSELQ